jgi:1,2-diacylglycerol 3-alpha-glucosyltransferase
VVGNRPRLVTIWASYGSMHIARVNALEELGFEVYAYSYSNLVPSYEFFRETPLRHRLINDAPSDFVNPVGSLWRTLRQLRHDQPDLILACGYERPETLAALVYANVKRLAGAQRVMVMIMMDNQLDDRLRRPLTEAVKRQYLRLFDGFSVGGSSHIAYLEHLRVDTGKILTGYNCVDNARISTSAATFRKSADSPPYTNYFLTLGRLIPKKNVSLIIDAYAAYRDMLPAANQPWDLVIAGDGPTRQELQDQVRRGNLSSSVHMVGRIDQLDEAVRYYSFCKAFVLASNRSEQWGLVVNEAMAAGVPVLVSRQCGCSTELVRPEVNGFVFDGNSVSDLTDRLLWIHRNEHQLQAMGQAAQSIVDEYSPRNFAVKVARYYWDRRANKTMVPESPRPPDS